MKNTDTESSNQNYIPYKVWCNYIMVKFCPQNTKTTILNRKLNMILCHIEKYSPCVYSRKNAIILMEDWGMRNHIDCLLQNCGKSIANAMELL